MLYKRSMTTKQIDNILINAGGRDLEAWLATYGELTLSAGGSRTYRVDHLSIAVSDHDAHNVSVYNRATGERFEASKMATLEAVLCG